ncbi:hypothetical protein G9444_6576 (plasmid) [Rhodococcus erythropolis]|uniref:Uncharacterized protein n=1 Tax=Rhodococcus erythropolis TaxID=1833 RepID=A0A6G9D3R2_RHOER|nr:hypothetical protein N601_30885 [Rhodococcus erythropolis DN1]QIP43819.1 hypothetical protein G9444_6576 [Rhodococcus erythropolis]
MWEGGAHWCARVDIVWRKTESNAAFSLFT